MATSETKRFRKLIAEVDRILWEDWDPLRMKGGSELARNEYTSYVEKLASLARRETAEAIAAELTRIQLDRMGLQSANGATDYAVAQRLRQAAEKFDLRH